MSAAPQQTRIFGMKLGLDPKILVGILLVLAAGLFIYNSRSENDADTAHNDVATTPVSEAPVQAPRTRAAIHRARQTAADRGTLSIHPVDATRGDIDPRLRLDILARLNGVSAGAPGRSLFEIGAAPEAAATMAQIQKLNKHIVPTSLTATQPGPQIPVVPQVNIPFKYYGFVKSADGAHKNRGLFLEGENVVVAAEGETIANRYLVAELTLASARVEDTQMKQGKTLPVTPEAQEQ